MTSLSKVYIVPVLFLSLTRCFAQNEFITAGSFNIYSENNRLVVKDSLGSSVLDKKFISPIFWSTDLDSDGIDELLVTDSLSSDGFPEYYLYLFTAVDSFSLVDSVCSGMLIPYHTYSDETECILLITGKKEFNKYIVNHNFEVLPLDCWKYENDLLFKVNDEVYEIFITENDWILNVISKYFESNVKNCFHSNQIKSLIVSAYINYMSAEEYSMAGQLLSQFYHCDDLSQFKEELENILRNQQ
ncbi:MAG: hypothetical protein HXY49_10645 [Ignavibacteriaceae bacterium]|nr:hypothetical protein [Ignavibacteriaceae bacterium]